MTLGGFFGVRYILIIFNKSTLFLLLKANDSLDELFESFHISDKIMKVAPILSVVVGMVAMSCPIFFSPYDLTSPPPHLIFILMGNSFNSSSLVTSQICVSVAGNVLPIFPGMW